MNDRIREIVNLADQYQQPMPIFVSGPPGAGKAIFAKESEEYIRSLRGQATVFELDNYLRDIDDPYLSKIATKTNFGTSLFCPEAYHATQAFNDVIQLYLGQAIEMPIYDFTASRRIVGERKIVRPAKYLIVKGRFAITLLEDFPDHAVRVYLNTKKMACQDRYVKQIPIQEGMMFSVANIYEDRIWPLYQQHGQAQNNAAHFRVCMQ